MARKPWPGESPELNIVEGTRDILNTIPILGATSTQKKDRWWLRSISQALTSPQQLGLLEKTAPLWVIPAFEKFSGMKVPEQSPGALLGTPALPFLGVTAQLGTGPQEKGL